MDGSWEGRAIVRMYLCILFNARKDATSEWTCVLEQADRGECKLYVRFVQVFSEKTAKTLRNTGAYSASCRCFAAEKLCSVLAEVG